MADTPSQQTTPDWSPYDDTDASLEAACRAFCVARGSNPDDRKIVILGEWMRGQCDEMPLWRTLAPAMRLAIKAAKEADHA